MTTDSDKGDKQRSCTTYIGYIVGFEIWQKCGAALLRTIHSGMWVSEN